MSNYIQNLFSLEGKTALVTGGSKGLGLMLSESLVKAGAKVFISSRSKDTCDTVAEELSKLGTCISLPYDLSVVENIESLAKDIKNAGHGLDILINNSGSTWGAPLETYPEKAWVKVMGLNVISPFYLVQKLLPLLEEGGTMDDPARIINIGSVSALTSESISAYAYVSSKAAIHQLTKALARDLVKRQINVNAIAPGYFPSKMTKHIMNDEKLKAEMLATIPMGRMGKAEDIGGLAVYLSSAASAFMTGNVLAIDGGFLVGE